MNTKQLVLQWDWVHPDVPQKVAKSDVKPVASCDNVHCGGIHNDGQEHNHNKIYVLSETETKLKDLDQILKHVADSSKPSFKSLVDGEDNNLRKKVSNCCSEFTEKGPVESHTQEDCVTIDGKALKAGECIESITDRFKETDSLMAEFQDSL
ncbi:hypothetical protein JD844_002866 [Phrynosoma platyrhinos]|uniref:Uncharacterized protein n=1 Tax=Phrynosoma platyrhinos TaxID=52577 RepID=A0ABQ7TCG8_PHRPL|nr:hypothetical protein JD844_002866 [Phrynosoma platyrhinos]